MPEPGHGWWVTDVGARTLYEGYRTEALSAYKIKCSSERDSKTVVGDGLCMNSICKLTSIPANLLKLVTARTLVLNCVLCISCFYFSGWVITDNR